MELRLDRLLTDLRCRPDEILAAIDADPLLVKRESGGLVLANASQALYTPQQQHQLYAKGIVYRRDPYRLVSLPLIKVYNVGERNVTVGDLTELGREAGVRVKFLRKIDGSLIQVFRAQGRVWFTTRGMIEGARWRFSEGDEDRVADFDFLAESRSLAELRYPRLLDDPHLLEGRTLLFELIHPRVRKVTSYGERADLVLLGGFDQQRFAYLPYEEVSDLGRRHELNVVDALAPGGETLGEQIEQLLAALAGTDEEGSVVNFERADEVVYRVKVKSPDYLHLMRLMTSCTYDRTVEILNANPELRTWADLEAYLQDQGRERVPEEVLNYYRAHLDTYLAYLADCDALRQWALRTCAEIKDRLGEDPGRTPGEARKAFAGLAVNSHCPGLLFAALDDRLDHDRLRKTIRNPREARELVTLILGPSGEQRPPVSG